MATTKKNEDEPDAAEAAREAAAAVEPAEDDETFDHDWLIAAGPGALGFQSHEVAGALSAVSKKNLTIEEAKSAVKAWLKAPVKTEA